MDLKESTTFLPYGDDNAMVLLHGDSEAEMRLLGVKLAALVAKHCSTATFVQAVEIPADLPHDTITFEMAKGSNKRIQNVRVELEGKNYFLLASGPGCELFNARDCRFRLRCWTFYKFTGAMLPVAQPGNATQRAMA